MKKLNKFIWGLVSACVLTLGACTDDVPSEDFGNSPQVEGEGVYFPNSMKTSYTLSNEDPDATAASGVIKLPVQRTQPGVAVTVDLKAEMDAATAAVFTVPNTVQFLEGKDTASVKILIDNAERGVEYSVKLTFAAGTEYANSTQTIAALYPNKEVWEVVTEEAVFVDQIFSLWGVGDVVFTGVTVEKLKDKNKYRFLSVYDNDYFTGIGLSAIFPADFELPYIILDGETYSKPEEGEDIVKPENALWQIPRTYLGFSLSSTLDFKYDPTFLTFGSFAYNLSTSSGVLTEDDYALGSFNKKKQMFDLGVCFHNLPDFSFQQVEGFQLWLDKSKMEVVYDRDYAPWTPMEEATGTYYSGILGEDFIVNMEQGTTAEGEDPIFHLTSVYADKVNITFFHNKEKNTVRVPKKQDTGMVTEVGGNKIYVDAKKASYDPEKETYIFEMEFYLIGEDGKKTATLGTGTEKFRVGYTGITLDDLQRGKSIVDYCGNWVAPFLSMKDGNTGNSLVSVIPLEGENGVIIRGLSALDPKQYDDAALAEYDPESGLLFLFPQDVTSYGKYGVVLSTYDVNDPGNYNLDSYLIGGLTEDGIFAFVNAPENEVPANSVRYLAIDGNQALWLNTFVPYPMEWSAYVPNRTAAPMQNNKPALTPLKDVVSKASRVLNVKPVPVETNKLNGALFSPVVVNGLSD